MLYLRDDAALGEVEDIDRVGRRMSDEQRAVGDGDGIESRLSGQVDHGDLTQTSRESHR